MAGIICDSREDDVYRYLEGEIALVKEALEFGDFLIKMNNEPRILLERKTWKDLSGSIASCRINEQIDGLVKAKNEHDIRIGFIIEGIAFPNPNTKLRKTTYGALLAKMRHMYIRHNIPYFQTRDHEGTANLLINFAKDLEKMEGRGISDTSLSSGRLGGRRRVSQDTQLRDMWSKLPSVSKINAHIIGGNISLREFMTTGEEEIASMTYDSGNKIGNKKAQNIIKGRDNHLLLLSAIPGLSKKSAEILLESKSFPELIAMSEKEWQELGKEKGLRIGKKTSEKIVTFINAKITK